MPTAVVEDETDFHQNPSAAPPASAVEAFLNPILALGPPGSLGSREVIEKELDLIAAVIRTWYAKPADQVLRECSAYSARLSELAVLLHRVEGTVEGGRRFTRIRTQQVERYLAEIDRQWKTASRLIEVSRQDLEVMK